MRFVIYLCLTLSLLFAVSAMGMCGDTCQGMALDNIAKISNATNGKK